MNDVVAAVRNQVADLPVDRRVDADLIADLVVAHAPLLTPTEARAVVSALLAEVRGLGPVDPLLADATVTEVMVNGPGPVWVERRGRLERTDVVVDRAVIERLVERVLAPLGLRADRTEPLVDARLADGSRVNVVVPPLAVDGPYLTIRRFAAAAVPLEAFTDGPMAALLCDAVRDGRNLIVSGGTSSGKTTLLNALAAAIPPGQRIVTVEDAAELRLAQQHVVRLEGRPANAEGAGAVTIRQLVRNALRMRPDRIIVGECRGAETLDMLQAMNTGHDGSMSTCHANSPADAVRRLETMASMADTNLPLRALREQLASAVDLVVQVRRSFGCRTIVAVAAVEPHLVDGNVVLRAVS